MVKYSVVERHATSDHPHDAIKIGEGAALFPKQAKICSGLLHVSKIRCAFDRLPRLAVVVRLKCCRKNVGRSSAVGRFFRRRKISDGDVREHQGGDGNGPEKLRVTGELTMHGATRPVTLDVANVNPSSN